MPPENGKKRGPKRKDNGYLKPMEAGAIKSDVGESMATTCPDGHPVETNGCTGAFCVKTPYVPPEVPGKVAKRAQDATSADLVPVTATTDEKLAGEEHSAFEGEAFKLRRQAGRYRARMKEFAVPEGLEGKAAEDFADKRAASLLPGAMAELEYQLKYGDDKQRMEAARDVRDMTGRGKRDGSGAGGPTIILVNSGQNPFLKRVSDGDTVTVTPVLPTKTHA